MRKLYPLILLMVLNLGLPAQLYFEPSFYHMAPEKLGSSNIFAQFWDKTGAMWAVTDKGLVCHNGFSSKHYVHKDGDSSTILSDGIQSASIDQNQDMWISYREISGVSRLNMVTGKMRHYLCDSTKKNSLPEARIIGFKEDKRGNFWMITWGSGIIKMDKNTGECKVYKPDPTKPNDIHLPRNSQVKGFFELPDGKILLGYFGDESKRAYPAIFDPVAETFSQLPIEEYTKGLSKE